jgi:hypothetical protein
MGCSTEFVGKFEIDPPLDATHILYINKFNKTRRMKRFPRKCEGLYDPLRTAVGLPVGEEAEYFVGGTGNFGQDRDESILDYNKPPRTQPGLWCQWEVSEDGRYLQWDGGEKFYEYKKWLEYLIKNFFAVWGRTLNGEVKWQGEDRSDKGVLVVRNNTVMTQHQEVSEVEMDDDIYSAFLDEAVQVLTDRWQEAGGGEIGEFEERSLRETLDAWFGDKRES